MKMLITLALLVLSSSAFAQEDYGTKCITRIDYDRDTRFFRGSLLNSIELNQRFGKLLGCVQVDLDESGSTITNDEYPTALKEWFEAIQSSGGTVELIAISIGTPPWFPPFPNFLLTVFGDYVNTDARDAARGVKAEIYYDRLTDVVLYVKFLSR